MKPHLEIVVDSNEKAKNKKYIEKLQQYAKDNNQHVIFYQMNSGDIRIGNILIELKTPQDFLSYQDGTLRIMNQVKRLKEAENGGLQPVVVILGTFGYLIKKYKRKFFTQKLPQYYGMINSLQWKWKVPVYEFKDNKSFYVWLRGVVKHQTVSRGLVKYSLRHTPSRIQNIEEEIHYVLQGVKGIGGAKTQTLIDEGETDLISTLFEIAHPYNEEEGGGIIIACAETLMKWENALGKKVFQHLRELLLYPFEKMRTKEKGD